MKNGLFVLDAHCHIYPAAIAAKAAAAIGTFYNHHSQRCRIPHGDRRARGQGALPLLMLPPPYDRDALCAQT